MIYFIALIAIMTIVTTVIMVAGMAAYNKAEAIYTTDKNKIC